ncbi:hypothetical protein [Actinokineospora sp.]|uniref:hypothetical protein n=1 Tax=Actinokineospora sp. TaxID=1872133 RepID=UPI0040380BD8
MTAETETVRGRFPARLVVEPTDGRFAVTDPRTRSRWVLGKAELDVARRFDGTGTYARLADALRRDGLPIGPPAKLRAFEQKLLGLGILESTAPRRRLARAAMAATRLDFAAADPTRALDRVLHAVPWLVRRPGVLAITAVTTAVLMLLTTRFDEFVAAVPAGLRGWNLLWLYLVTAASTVFHEGGHALACRAYGVAVREVGVGLRSLVVFAWTEPDQSRWAALPLGPRLVTVAAGPLGSLAYAAIGAACWLGPLPDPLRTLGLIMVLSGTVCVIPTMLPFFDGDTYLLLTGLPGCANLRSRSFAHLLGRGAAGDPLSVRLGCRVFAVLTILAHVAIAGLALWLVWFAVWAP